MYQNKMRMLMVSAIVLTALTGCGGDKDQASKSDDLAPVVVIAPSKNIFEDQDLVLFAEATDDGEIISYSWNAQEMNQIVSTKALLTVVAPHNVGVHRYAISVTDDQHQVTTKIVTVTVTARTDSPPIILMSDNKEVNDNQDLEIYAEATDDGVITSYLWKDSTGVTVGNESLLSIKAPHSIGIKKYTLIVTDDKGQSTQKVVSVTVKDSKFAENAFKIKKYVANMLPNEYRLEQINDSSFNELSISNKYKVADKLLSSMFFAFTHEELTRRINSGTFISDIQSQLFESTNNMGIINNKIKNKDIYFQSETISAPEFLSRFFEMKELDKSYLNHWISYILTQTILFSPAVELGSVSDPDSYGVYNRLYNALENETGMRYATFNHMISNENWRRFRSPEDNGREMLEIYALNENDEDVPISAKALQNWHLNERGTTLVIGLNKNTEPLSIGDDMQFTTGKEFYASLANSKGFTKGVTYRLVDFMFTGSTKTQKDNITTEIVSSNPETWNDILSQIIFSKEYLLNTTRVKSIEELAFPLMKKLNYNSNHSTFNTLRFWMLNMSQASMKYKLGKLTRIPVDNISFANYQKYLRNYIMRTWSRDTRLSFNPRTEDKDGTNNSEYVMSTYNSHHRRGVSNKHFMTSEKYQVISGDREKTLTNYINYLFNSILNRNTNAEELTMFLTQFEKTPYYSNLTYINENDKDYEEYIRNSSMYYMQYQVFEYLLRLDELYFFKKVK